jgi:TonB-dependent receptor
MHFRNFQPVLWTCFFSLLLSVSGYAQVNRGAISGHATDSAGAVLQGATVELQPKGAPTTTDVQGNFSISNLPAGEYTLTVLSVGFAQFTTKVTVATGLVVHVDAALKVATESEEIMVHAEREHGEAEAVNRERTADNILNVLPAEVITSLPNANVADAIGRLPSVTLERDEGEGKYVQIRGTEPRLSNLTIDGINVPSPENGVRQVKLDTIPADLVESVEINKTLQANQDGDGIGGSVNLKTKTAGETPTLDLTTMGGYTPIIGGRYTGQTDATVGQRFGANKRLGVLFGGGYDYNGRGIDDIEPSPTIGSAAPSYDSMDIREYKYDRSRWGFAGSVDYKLSEMSGIYVRGLYSDFKDYGDKWAYSLNNGDVPSFSTSSRRPDFGIGSLAAGGRHEFTSSWFTWEASVARSRQLDSGGDPGAKFKATGTLASSTGCVFDPAATTDVYRPQWSPNCFTPGPDDAFDPTMYKLKSITTSFGHSAQLNLLGSASYGKNYHLGSHFGTLEIGGKVRNAHKFDNSFQDEWDPNGTLPMTQFLGGFHNNNYYDGSYKLGPETSWDSIISFLNANQSAFALTPGSAYGNDGNFDLIERISAGYAMNSIEFGKFRLVGGVRFEGTQVSTLSFSDVNNTFSVPGGGTYVDVLPSIALRYALTKNSGLRVVYGRGLSRPDPQDLTTATSFDGVDTFTVGNPALKPEHADNYDVLYEQYLNPLGMIQAGFFYKNLGDPIIETTQKPTTGQFAGFIVDEPDNAGSAYVMGFELAYQQHLSFLPGPMRGFGISANYSYTTSQASGIPGRTDQPALLRQAPNTWNISPTYDRSRLTLRMGMTYNAANIFAYQFDPTNDPTNLGPKGPAGDNYLYSHLQLDAQGSYRLWRGLSLIAYGLNMNNEVFGFYNGSPQYVVQREYYKPTVAVGFRWTQSAER